VIALAKKAGVRTLNIVRRESAVQPLLDAGADAVLVSGEGLRARAREAIGRDPIALILDAVGGEPVAQLASLAAPGAVVVSYAALDLKPVGLSPVDLIFRALSVRGFWLVPWLRETPGAKVSKIYDELSTLVAEGALAAPIDATYLLDQHRAAFAHAAENGDGRNGKVLFTFN
jgi:NADPH:quinone reductase-like Zn-dependent oxidoreductase